MFRSTLCAVLFAVGAVLIGPASAAEPIRIGFGMALTGPLAGNGKSAQLAMQIWRDDINAKGGLLGRPIELVTYDDQSNPATVPGIYTKLLDIDKVDLVVSGYATNLVAPALPIVMQHNMVLFGLLALQVNNEFHYPRYFSINPSGANGAVGSTKGFFELAAAMNPKPQTIAIVAADAEYGKNASGGARDNAKDYGFKVVYDRTYPPSTTDFAPLVRAVQATSPDLIFVASYPLDTVGIIRAAHEIGLKTGLFGGGMVGTQTTSIKTQLGPLLNGVTSFDFWLPAPTMQFPGVLDFIKTYQERAAGSGVDALGYYMGPWAYAELQILGDAVTATKGLDQAKLAEYLHRTTFKTVVGDLAFAADGEFTESRTLMVQYQNVTGTDLDQFKDGRNPIIVWPQQYKDGNVTTPFEAARQ
ncbi:MAG: amino acid ABC transporter substrate-binding protein [Alphaproteobacteria bacterium]|nr:amino acid ABC transporter substrate-binding protein [Alphaproteobacteria bacterium]